MTNYLNLEDVVESGIYKLTLHVQNHNPAQVRLVSISGAEYLFQDLADEVHFIGTSANNYYDVWGCEPL